MGEKMKRFLLMLAVSGSLLATSALLLAGGAGAANPHGPKGDPSATCGQGSTPCADQNLPQSNGCNSSSTNNPHCQSATSGVTPTTPSTTPSTPVTPATGTPAAQGVAGEQGSGNVQAATAVQHGKAAGELPFTGLETMWLALFGAAVLASGLALRARSSS
jgi:hypothetical protein